MNQDQRLLAIEWLHQNVPDGATLLLDSYTTPVSSQRYQVLMARDGELVPWSDISPKLRPFGPGPIASGWRGSPGELLEAIEASRVDYIVVSHTWMDLYRAEESSYPMEVATYDALMHAFPVAETFQSDDDPIGWHVTILQASTRVD
jgi:hypothetical protein